MGWGVRWIGALTAVWTVAAWQASAPRVGRWLARSVTDVGGMAQRSPVSRVVAHGQGAQASVDSLGNPAPIEPDRTLTPGATLPVTTQDICTPGYSRKVRNVPIAVKREVYSRYGIAQHQPGEYEVDHLISLELGGSNSVRNLWPESYWTTPLNAHVKDALENRLHREVCAGRLSLQVAQQAIATDWVAAYGQYVTKRK